MRKGLLKTLLLAFIAVLCLGTEKAKAGHDIGALSKDNPCVYVKFSMQNGEDFFGAFFKTKDKATKVKLTIVNLSEGDFSLKAGFVDASDGKWEDIKTLTFKKGKKKSTFNLPDLKKGGEYFIEINKPNYYDQKEIKVGLCVYSEDLGGEKHDFTKLVLSNDELSLKKGKTATLKATLDKSLQKEGVIWSTSDKKVATVSKKGKVKAVGGGGALITCTSKKNKKITAQCTIWVDGDPAPGEPDNPVTLTGDINDVTLTEEPFGLDTAHRYLTLQTNGFSGDLTLEFTCDNGTDTRTVTVEKNKTYVIDYEYDFVNCDENWAEYLLSHGTMQLTTKALGVNVKGGKAFSGYQKLTANIFNMGKFNFYEE